MGLNRQIKRRHQKQSLHQRAAGSPQQPVAVAWYDEQQYQKLLEVAVNRHSLHETHGAWLEAAESMLSKLPYDVVRVPVQVDALMAWCQELGIPNNGSTRSQYALQMSLQRS
jgi:hypothetical protein